MTPVDGSAAATAGENVPPGAAEPRAQIVGGSAREVNAADSIATRAEKEPDLARNSVSTNPEFRELMEEPPGGVNAGRAASTTPNDDGRHLPLDVESEQALDFVRGGGWSIVDTRHRPGEAGMTSFRGVLRGDEHIDEEVVTALVEDAFGFSRDDVRAAYRRGRPAKEQGELRAQIDARLLALSRQGANMTLLARLIGLGVTSDGTWPISLKRAIARAKAAELPNEGSQ